MFARAAATAALLAACAAAAPASAGELKAGAVLDALVRVEAEIPADARTARFLGTEREATAVVIDDSGLAVTIGYTVMEAMAATVTDSAGTTVPAEIVAYDYDTGFGLVRALAPISAAPMRLGDSGAVEYADRVLIAAVDSASPAVVAARREFAGYWEYLLEDAIFTAPAFADWAGAALVSADGQLLGIGSLFLRRTAPDGRTLPVNMFVPIDALKPILADLLDTGRGPGPPRPWMGMFTRNVGGEVMVTRVLSGGPADAAGVMAGEIVRKVAGRSVSDMAELFRRVWALGAAGVEAPLELDGRRGARNVTVRTADRYDYLKMDPSF